LSGEWTFEVRITAPSGTYTTHRREGLTYEQAVELYTKAGRIR